MPGLFVLSQSEPIRAHGCRLHQWETALRLLVICCFFFVLSGCSASLASLSSKSAGSVSSTDPNSSSQSGSAVPILSVHETNVQFGSVLLNTIATQSVIFTSSGTAPVTIDSAILTGAGFALSGASFPLTLTSGQTATLDLQFLPTTVGQATGELTVSSNSSTASNEIISLSGTGTGTSAPAALSLLSCSSGTMVGAGTDVCTATLTAAAPSGGLTVNLSSSNSAVKVPSTVTVPSGATSAGFTATVASVTTAQAATITASVGSMLTSYTLQLNATILALSINPPAWRLAAWSSTRRQLKSVTLTSTGTAPVTINGITLTGTSFTLSGPALPVTLNPNQATTVYVSFDPTAASTATGQLTISSNASTNGTVVIGLSGTGLAAVTVTPASVSTTVGTTQQFAASVTGTSNTAVTWTVSGAGCSGNACGTFTSSGLYTAPAAAPSPATVTITATSVADPTQSASSTVIIVPTVAATYYIAPAAAGGNDSNNGLTPQTPWLTPKHNLTAPAIIYAAAGTYAPTQLQNQGWGTCSSGGDECWVICSTPFACSVSSTTQNAVEISMSYWGVQGFVASAAGNDCFVAEPDYAAGLPLHNVIFANDIANGCKYDGFSTNAYYNSNPVVGTDYVAYLGDIAYGAGGNSTTCSAGLSFYLPVASDTLPGTHYYMGGNFAWGNTSNCGDGEGAIFDTLDGSQCYWSNPCPTPYRQQMVAENNLFIWNNGPGLQVDINQNGTGPWAQVYFKNNTVAYNQNGPSAATECGQINEATTYSTESTQNLVVAPTQYCFGGTTYRDYGDLVSYSTANTVKVYQEFAYSAYGNGVGEVGSSGFTAGPNNTTSTNPSLANPVKPGAPSCSGRATTTACMASEIGNFAPTNAAANGYGYQTPSSTSVSDALFPQWLCGVSNIPTGLVTMGCS